MLEKTDVIEYSISKKICSFIISWNENAATKGDFIIKCDSILFEVREPVLKQYNLWMPLF